MIGKEVLDTLQALGLQEKEASARRLGEILQMLVDDPTISLRDWRLMFHKTTAYLKNPLEKIWYLGDQALVRQIFHTAFEMGAQGLPNTDWMAETLAEYIRKNSFPTEPIA